MANFDRSGMTQAGINLMGKAVGGATIQFTRLVLGDGTMTGEILDLKGVVSPKQNVDVTRIERNNSQCTVGGELLTSSVKQGFFWRESGLYAMDPDVGEILYNYASSSKPDWIADSSSNITEEILVAIVAIIGSTTNVDVNIDESMVFATRKDTTIINNYITFLKSSKMDKSYKITSADLDTSSQSNKIKLVNLSDEVREAIAGTAPVLPIIGDGDVTLEKLADCSVDFNKINVSFVRADIMAGTISIDTKNKTIASNGLSIITQVQNRSISNTTINFDGNFNLFVNTKSSILLILPLSNYSSVPVERNYLAYLCTFYNGKILNATSKESYIVDGLTCAYNALIPEKKAEIYCGSTYSGYSGKTKVTFDEVNQVIVFPKNANIVIGSKSNILTQEIILPINKELFSNTVVIRIAYDFLTKDIVLQKLSLGSEYTFDVSQISLGSFLLEWENDIPKFRNIHGYFSYELIQNKKESLKTIPSVWNGKVGSFVGDSITEGANGNYVNKVKEVLGLSKVNNYGIGGGRLCKTTPEIDALYTPLVSRYQEIDLESDIVFVLIGTNDYASQVPIGENNSTNEYEFKGGLNILMNYFRDNFPGKLVIFSTLLHRLRENDTNKPITPNMYRDAIREMCELKHFICYDAYKMTGFDFSKAYYDHVLSNDGLHPNQKGADILGRKIAGFININ